MEAEEVGRLPDREWLGLAKRGGGPVSGRTRTSFSAVKEELTSNPRRPPPGLFPIRQHGAFPPSMEEDNEGFDLSD